MKIIPISILTLALGTLPAWATAQQQQDPQQQQQQPGQQQQMEQQQQQQQKFLSEARIDGKVRSLQDDSITIGVAGTEIELRADQQQLEGLSEGDVVETTAIPLPEAQQVTPMAEVDQQQRQQLQQQQQQQPLEAVVPGEGENMDRADEAQVPRRGTDHDEREARIPGEQNQQQEQETQIPGQQQHDQDRDQEAVLPGQQDQQHERDQETRIPGQQQQDQQRQQDNNDNGEAEALLPGQDEYVLSGTVTQVQDNIVQFQTEQHGELSFQMDEQQAQDLEQGQEYMIQLSQLPDEAEQWKARDIQQL